MSEQSLLDDVKNYYGKVLKTSDDLKTNVCKTASQKMPNHVLKAMKLVHDDVVVKYYGCGLIIPENVQGCKVLDLGSGSGRDCYILSKLVGENGQVTGIDMTEEQIDVARKYIDYHTKTFGFSKPNVEFKKGYIERLWEAGIAKNEYDVIVSNCVVNLSPDKRAVLREAYDSLKVGGEMYFSDVYCDKVLPEHIRKEKVLWGEGLSGALAWTELVQLAEEVGFSKPRLVKASPITVDNEEMAKLVTGYKYVSVTYRLVKLPLDLQPKCQVIYEGTIEGAEEEFFLDYATSFKAGDIVSVDSEVATFLHCSRYNSDFTLQPCDKGQNGSACCPTTKKHNPDPFALLEGKGLLSSR
ncbi:arsenite methyltransferase-like [Lineus longissimus]|uniref:arsenite methyltransferase-like n=1 Tax=Lineus longissimus TaxID=88925 RepID=UPI002B4E2906